MKISVNYARLTGLFLSLIILVLVLNSCEVAGDIIGNATVAKLEGEWSCDETSEIYKKATTSVYSVYISADADNDNGVIIDNFYALGDLGVKAEVSGLTISISSQTVDGGFIISGSGIISSNYKVITWNYTVNDGGDIDHVTAVYTTVE